MFYSMDRTNGEIRDEDKDVKTEIEVFFVRRSNVKNYGLIGLG